ncbi:hypothetical protein PENTCL1PPCAC_16225, partial [Pristionchus entomophagus]
KVIALQESLHTKIDALPKCECNTLRQELAEVKKLVSFPSTVSLAPPSADLTYSIVKRAVNDATTYAEKACRAVWVGLPECPSSIDTSAADQKSLEELCKELNDATLTKALADGHISHKRHPETRGDRKNRILKINGCGVAILCSPLLNPILVSSFTTESIESLIIDIHFSSPNSSLSFHSIRICLIYRAPSCSSTSIDTFLTFIECLIGLAPFIMCGDLNFPAIDWHTLTFSKYFASVSTSPLQSPLPSHSPPLNTPLFDLPFISISQILIAISSLAPKCNLSPDSLPNIFYYLGIIMNPSLKFTDHISRMVSKARAKINIMFKCLLS